MHMLNDDLQSSYHHHLSCHVSWSDSVFRSDIHALKKRRGCIFGLNKSIVTNVYRSTTSDLLSTRSSSTKENKHTLLIITPHPITTVV
jgi:hypothetical protein